MSGLIGPQAFSNAVTPYYLPSGAPIVTPTIVSPLTIKSPDGTDIGQIYQNDNGNMVIAGPPVGALYLGSGNNLFYSPDQSKTAQLAVVNNGDVGFYQASGGTLFLGGSNGSVALQNLSTAPLIRVGAENGIVYDSYYNKPFTFTTLQAQTTGNIAYNQTLTPSAGKYQLQLTVENPVAPAGSSLEMFAVDLPGTQVINFSGAEVLSSSVGTNLLTLNSGYFTYDGVGGLKVEIIVTGSAWSGTWEFQLVKLG